MSRKRGIACGGVAVVLVGGFFALSRAERSSGGGPIALVMGLVKSGPRPDAPTDHLGDFAAWTPTAAEIAAEVGTGDTGRHDDERHIQFASLFQKRYRTHDHAIGLKFVSPTRIKAMFAPIIPRWDMSAVALAAAREAESVFGKQYDVDIYETYITMPMIKVAEVRQQSGTDKLNVRFDPKFAREGRKRQRRQSPAEIAAGRPTNGTVRALFAGRIIEVPRRGLPRISAEPIRNPAAPPVPRPQRVLPPVGERRH